MTEPKTPVDVFTRVLSERIGRTVTASDIHGSNYSLVKVESVEAGVVTFVTDLGRIFEGTPEKSRNYVRIDQLSSVHPMESID